MHQCSYVLARYDLLEIAHDIHVENVDGEVILHAHGSGGDVRLPQR